ncbi:MAG: response regulator [Anaerolineae bacterium]|nr:response regulator [Anaerolineae bacterium]
MKRILVACDHPQMDNPLRRSLAHLVTSCEIDVAYDGYTAFEQISRQPYDLIVVDFLLPGLDSLELVESIQYIDPGVPVILLLQKEHKSIKQPAHTVKAQPILCPFKPLKFLRLVDKLLHQQLNRYRQLAGTLQTILETLRQQTCTPCVFLAEENGQVLLSHGELDEEQLAALGNLAVGVSMLEEELKRLFAGDKTLHAHYQRAQKNHGLYVVPATENLNLALLSSQLPSVQDVEIWRQLDQTALQIQQAFDCYHQGATPSVGDEHEFDQPEILAQDHVFIPLSFEIEFDVDEAPVETISPPEQVEREAEHEAEADLEAEEDEVAVNWAILSSNANLLNRLHNLTRTD